MFLLRWLRQLYDWTMKWGESKYAVLALCIISFAEASFFPVPPDILLIAMCLSKPKKSFLYAGYTSIMSVTGGVAGFFIGYSLMTSVGIPILKFYGLMDWFNQLSVTFAKFNFWAVFIAALTPIPYKVFTITAGAVAANPELSVPFAGYFATFMLASISGRSIRFFGVSTLIYYFGKKVKEWIDKYFNWAALGLACLLVGGFLLIKYV